MKPKLLTALLFAVVAVVAALALLPKRVRETQSYPERAEERISDSGAQSASSDAGLEPQREIVASRPGGTTQGRVFSSLGGPVSGAEVSYSIASRDDAECEPIWRENDWGHLQRETARVLTNEVGEFSFDLPTTDMPHGVVLWASHPDFRAGTHVLPAERSAWLVPLEIVLEPARSMAVTVLDTEGDPVAGAVVEHYGIAAALDDNTSTEIGPARAPRLFERTYTTGADGRVAAVAFPGTQALVARRGREASLPWRGEWRGSLTLRLLPTFELGGTVTLPELPDDPTRERRIVVAAQTRSLWRDLVSIRGVEDGPWGPLTVPCIDAQRYRIRLEGAPIVPVEVFFPPPAPGSRRTEHLRAELGEELWFKVVDERGTVIPTARVKASWRNAENPEHWHFAEASKTREDQIGIVSVPRGSFEYEAWAPGFAHVRYGPFDTSICATAHLKTELQRAGILRGRVTHRGEPVEDFEIIVWSPAIDGSQRSVSFFGRSEGRFELDTVPIGEFSVTANAPLSPACEPVAVSCPPGGVAEVELELLDGITGRGRVVDQLTGQPIPEASIQVFIRGDLVPVGRWGLPIPVEPDGSFEVRAYLPGNNFIRALAEGYSNLVVTREIGAESVLEWGDIALARAQPLTIAIEPPERAQGTKARVWGSNTLPEIPFGPDGKAVYPEASLGHYGVVITESDASETTTQLEVTLVPGEDWTFPVRLAGENRLSVTVVSEGRETSVDWVRASYQSEHGYRATRTKAAAGQAPTEFEGIDASTVTVQAFLDQEVVAVGGGRFTNGRLDLELALDARDFLLRVVGPSGEPVPDVRVIVEAPSSPGFLVVGGSDARGECVLKGLPSEEIRVGLVHGSRGVRLGVPVDASAGSAEVVLDGEARLELLFLDGDVALPATICSLEDDTGAQILSGFQTDELGRVTIPNLAPDDYSLRATRPDCWPAAFTATATTDGSRQTIQLRRLGDIELQLSTAEGVPLRGLPVQLLSVEFDADVADWIQAGRVPRADLVSDDLGWIRLTGLPHGPYRWRAHGPSGPTEGELTVEPARNSTVRLALP